MSAQREFNPSELSHDQLKVIAAALIPQLNRFGIEEKPITQEEAADFLHCSVQTIINLRNRGIIKAYRFEVDSTPYYYPSDINIALRRSKK